MKIKLLIIAISISLLNMMCCGSNYTPITYEYLPTGKLEFINSIEKYQNLQDTVKGPFRIFLNLDTKQLYTFNFSFISTATACSLPEQSHFNRVNKEELIISIDKDFVYKDKLYEASKNIMSLDDSSQKFLFYASDNNVAFDEKFLYYAKFQKGWTTFNITGELEDGQKFSFEKEVYLDL